MERGETSSPKQKFSLHKGKFHMRKESCAPVYFVGDFVFSMNTYLLNFKGLNQVSLVLPNRGRGKKKSFPIFNLSGTFIYLGMPNHNLR